MMGALVVKGLKCEVFWACTKNQLSYVLLNLFTKLYLYWWTLMSKSVTFNFIVLVMLKYFQREQPINRRQLGKRTNLKTVVSRKQSTPNFPKNEHFLPPDTHTCAYQWVRNVHFSEHLACLVFLLPPFRYLKSLFYFYRNQSNDLASKSMGFFRNKGDITLNGKL